MSVINPIVVQSGGGGGGGELTVPAAAIYEYRPFKTTTTSSLLRWQCSTALHSVAIFVDEEENYYTPAQVRIFLSGVYKTYANQTTYSFGTSVVNPGTVTFKAQHPTTGVDVAVGLLAMNIHGDGIGDDYTWYINAFARIEWSTYQGAGHYSVEQTRRTYHAHATPETWFDGLEYLTEGHVSSENHTFYKGEVDNEGFCLELRGPDED